MPFEEIRINKGDYVSIKKGSFSDQPLFGLIDNVPISMLCT